MDITFIVIFQVLTRLNICKSRYGICAPLPATVVNILNFCFKNYTVKFVINIPVLTCSCYHVYIIVFARLHLFFLSID